jgi:hypothetical protein
MHGTKAVPSIQENVVLLPKDYYRSFIGPGRFLFFVLSNPRLIRPGLRIAGSAIRNFFMPQYQNTLFQTRPNVYVDHPLDRKIPYDPSTATIYIGFIRLWMNAVHWLGLRYGKAATQQLSAFLEGIAGLYDDAGSIYWRYHTTTIRPSRSPNLTCAVIQVLDPHLNCIPSLHVTIVFGAWIMARRLAAAMADLDNPRTAAWLDALYGHAQRITETTMLMKQHSVNCVGASLWYLMARYPAEMGRERIDSIIEALFTMEGQSVQVKANARTIIRMVVHQLDQSTAGADQDWQRVLLRFIESFSV